MRLRRLHLTRYGGFRDAVLDLPRPDGPDVTLVIGPNEAGKSTAFSAWLDVLFGIPGKTPANWRFPRPELDIAADIETPAGTRLLRRLPTKADTLRDGDGSPLPESEVAALLHGLSRDGYRTRFSLDREMLERGGQDIAGGQGDLGDLLFAGMAGLPGIQSALDQTRAAADGFHKLGKPRTKSTALGAGLAELKEADAALKARLTPQVQARLDAAVATAEAAQASAEETLHAARRATACERDAQALREIDSRIAGVDAKLAGLPHCTWSPSQAESARTALREVQRLTVATREASETLDRLQADLDGCPTAPDEGVAAAVLDALGAMEVDGTPVIERLGPVNDADLARITTRRDAARDGIAAARTRFGLTGPVAGVADRIEPALRAAADAASTAQRTERALAEATAALDAMTPPPDVGDTTALRDAMDGLARIDLPALRRDRDAKAETFEQLSPGGAIPPDLPDPDQLRSQIARHRDGTAVLASARQAEDDARIQRDARQRIADDARRADAGADAAAVETARQERDAAWQHHRAALDAPTADTFEGAMARHDHLVAGSTAAAVRAETARAAREALAEADAVLAARTQDLDRATQAVAAQDIASLATRLGLPADAAPDTLPARLERLREAARAAPAAERAEEALQSARQDHALILTRLRRLLGDGPDPEDAARARLRDAEAAAEAKGRFDSARDAVERAEKDHATARAAVAEADRKLELERTAAGLGPLDLADLPALRALEVAEAKDADDARRQSALMRARDAAAAHIDRLTKLGATAADPIGFARSRAITDRDAQRARQAARTARDTAKDALDRLQRAARDAQAALALSLDGQGGSGPAADRVAALSEAAWLTADRSMSQREADTLAVRHDPAALSAARALPPDPARLAALQDTEARAEAALRDAIAATHDATRLRADAQGGDTAAAAAQSRAAILAGLGDGARRAAAALIGHMAGRAALSRLVQENRGPMVAVASDAFRRITGGEWDGLEVFGPDGMTLQAHAGERRSAVHSLSMGARGQLFLALRVAGHAAFCDRHAPLPFVTDDILEAFDDTRAEAALRMAGEMGTRGQVVFFTHHDHIVTLARSAIPTVSVVKMPRQGGRTG